MPEPHNLAALLSALNEQVAEPSRQRPVVLSLGGASGSGKSTVVADLQQRYPDSIVLSSDDYYLGKTRARQELPAALAETFESPQTMDLGKLATHLYMLKTGAPIEQPVYDMMLSEPLPRTKMIDPQGKNLIIFEGLPVNLGLFKGLVDISACVCANPEIRLARRIARDRVRNAQSAEQITHDFETIIEPAYVEFYAAADLQADFIVSND